MQDPQKGGGEEEEQVESEELIANSVACVFIENAFLFFKCYLVLIPK